MKTTIKTIQIPTPSGTEVLDMSDFVEKDQMNEAIDKVCSKIDENTSDLADKIDNIKLPEIDTTELAKQGEDPDATNTAIFNSVKSIPDLSLLYAARAEKNDDGVNTYSIVLPVTAKITYDNNGVATILL